MLISRSAWFCLAMVPMVLVLGWINTYVTLGRSELTVGVALCAAIAARITDPSLLEWKMLFMMVSGSLVGLLLFQSWPSGKVFCEFIFWWGVFGIPLRATMRPINERKR